MCQSMLVISTANAPKYLQQLCRHFSRKVQAEWSTHQGQVSFPVGDCAMRADGSALIITCCSKDKEQLVAHKLVIEKHVELVARRESIDIIWHDD